MTAVLSFRGVVGRSSSLPTILLSFPEGYDGVAIRLGPDKFLKKSWFRRPRAKYLGRCQLHRFWDKIKSHEKYNRDSRAEIRWLDTQLPLYGEVCSLHVLLRSGVGGKIDFVEPIEADAFYVIGIHRSQPRWTKLYRAEPRSSPDRRRAVSSLR